MAGKLHFHCSYRSTYIILLSIYLYSQLSKRLHLSSSNLAFSFCSLNARLECLECRCFVERVPPGPLNPRPRFLYNQAMYAILKRMYTYISCRYVIHTKLYRVYCPILLVAQILLLSLWSPIKTRENLCPPKILHKCTVQYVHANPAAVL